MYQILYLIALVAGVVAIGIWLSFRFDRRRVIEALDERSQESKEDRERGPKPQ